MHDHRPSNTFANLDFWLFLPKMRFLKSNKINALKFTTNLVFAPFRYLAKVLQSQPIFISSRETAGISCWLQDHFGVTKGAIKLRRFRAEI